MEERIYVADVIVRATLVSAEDGLLRFNAVEYLKGTGAKKLAVRVSTSGRNTQWDDQEAVLFLTLSTDQSQPRSSGSSTAAFEFADTTASIRNMVRNGEILYTHEYRLLSCTPMNTVRFTRKDDHRPVNSTLFVEAFGSVTGESAVDADEDLWSVFRGRAELMGWFSSLSGDDSPPLWYMEEAEMVKDSPMVGYGQVGVEPTRLVPRILPAVLHCFNDSVRRFGATTVSGFQVTTRGLVNLSDDACTWYLVFVLSWFNLDVRERVKAVVHFDQGLLGDHDVTALVDCIEQGNNGVFEFRLMDEVPVEARIRLVPSFAVHSYLLSPTQHPSQGLLVSMPEWSPSAAGWVLARVIDAAHTLGSKPSKYAVRISQVS